MSGIIESVGSKAIWSGISAGARSILGRNIQITSPRPQEMLSGAGPVGEGFCFPVRGTLKRRPEGHEIWLLTQDDTTALVWPQGFFPVQYDPGKGTWMGKINGSGNKQVRIVAAVAPPTSQDLFRYFQAVGVKRQYQFEPLKRIPLECRNQASVQAFIP